MDIRLKKAFERIENRDQENWIAQAANLILEDYVDRILHPCKKSNLFTRNATRERILRRVQDSYCAISGHEPAERLNDTSQLLEGIELIRDRVADVPAYKLASMLLDYCVRHMSFDDEDMAFNLNASGAREAILTSVRKQILRTQPPAPSKSKVDVDVDLKSDTATIKCGNCGAELGLAEEKQDASPGVEPQPKWSINTIPACTPEKSSLEDYVLIADHRVLQPPDRAIFHHLNKRRQDIYRAINQQTGLDIVITETTLALLLGPTFPPIHILRYTMEDLKKLLGVPVMVRNVDKTEIVLSTGTFHDAGDLNCLTIYGNETNYENWSMMDGDIASPGWEPQWTLGGAIGMGHRKEEFRRVQQGYLKGLDRGKDD